MHVKVHEKGDPNVPRRAELRFGFRDVSREPGVCLNWPANGADTKPDLRLRFADESLGQPSADGTSIETSGLVKEVDLIIESYDFGAWGTLRISGTDKDKKPVTVKVMGKGTPDLTIPLDDDGNRIADAWEPGTAGGKPADSDDEHQEGNSHDGDGLTLYEEYRGFVENGDRIQGNPTKKDFFVLNLIGKQADGGLNLFRDATQLNVHSKFTPEELIVHSRVINRYSSTGFQQHGVILARYENPAADPGYSQAVGGPGPPGKVSRVLISDENIARPKAIPGTAYTDADWEVAHELAHACNVKHHGEKDPEVMIYRSKSKLAATERSKEHPGGKGVDVQLLTEDGQNFDFGGNKEIEVWLAKEGGQHSGDEQCLMRYHKELAAYETPADYGEGSLPVRYLVIDQPLGTRMCSGKLGASFNGAQHEVTKYGGRTVTRPRWGDAAEGACFTQINVSDRAGGAH